MDGSLHLGTCSWKYESWRGVVYSDAPHPDTVADYAAAVPPDFRFGVKMPNALTLERLKQRLAGKQP